MGVVCILLFVNLRRVLELIGEYPQSFVHTVGDNCRCYVLSHRAFVMFVYIYC